MVVILVSVIEHIESTTGRIKLHESMGVDRKRCCTDGLKWCDSWRSPKGWKLIKMPSGLTLSSGGPIRISRVIPESVDSPGLMNILIRPGYRWRWGARSHMSITEVQCVERSSTFRAQRPHWRKSKVAEAVGQTLSWSGHVWVDSHKFTGTLSNDHFVAQSTNTHCRTM